MTKHRYRIRNWKDYNAALVHRGSLTFWVSEEALGSWLHKELTGKRGASPIYTDMAIETMAILQAVYQLDLRKTQGLMESIV